MQKKHVANLKYAKKHSVGKMLSSLFVIFAHALTGVLLMITYANSRG